MPEGEYPSEAAGLVFHPEEIHDGLDGRDGKIRLMPVACRDDLVAAQKIHLDRLLVFRQKGREAGSAIQDFLHCLFSACFAVRPGVPPECEVDQFFSASSALARSASDRF